jgi:hypothetical protein
VGPTCVMPSNLSLKRHITFTFGVLLRGPGHDADREAEVLCGATLPGLGELFSATELSSFVVCTFFIHYSLLYITSLL